MALPHLALPFRFVNGAAATVEQDTPDEIAQCVEVLLRTVTGQRIEVPGFGIADPLFTQESSRSTPNVLAQIKTWEPRARSAVSDRVESRDELVRNIKVTLEVADVNF